MKKNHELFYLLYSSILFNLNGGANTAMKYQIPSITALVCFEASARLLSITKAATELCLTQSAVSKQIKNLENLLTQPLFERIKQRLVLTNAGKLYLSDIQQLLKQLEQSTSEIQQTANSLLVAAEPAITSRWLIPKLNDFNSIHQNIQIDMITDNDPIANIDNFDVGIIYGENEHENYHCQLFLNEELIAVCAYDFLPENEPFENFKDIINYPILRHGAKQSSSDMWLKHCSLDSDKYGGQKFDHFNLLVDAAIEGLGICIVPSFFVKKELTSGKLIQACQHKLLTGNHYYLAVPKTKKNSLKIQNFISWVLTQK